MQEKLEKEHIMTNNTERKKNVPKKILLQKTRKKDSQGNMGPKSKTTKGIEAFKGERNTQRGGGGGGIPPLNRTVDFLGVSTQGYLKEH